MNRLRHILTVLTATAIGLASCGITGSRGNGDDNYFSAFATFHGQKWEYASPATFTVDTLRDSVARGTLMLSLRHTDGYEYSNIWLELSCRGNGRGTLRDTVNVILADVYGKWKGHGSGPSIQISDTISPSFTIHRGDTLVLRHIMRVDTLTDIEQAGLIFYP